MKANQSHSLDIILSIM